MEASKSALPLLVDKQVALIWGTHRLTLLRDKQVALIQIEWGNGFGGKQVALMKEQTSCLYWVTNRLPFNIGGRTGCHYWRTNRLPLLGDKQTTCLYWGINRLSLLGDK